jgi:hypothetical protein
MEELRDLYLKSIYWMLWKSADFESDFATLWPSTYEDLKTGNEDAIPTRVLEMTFQYAVMWAKLMEA